MKEEKKKDLTITPPPSDASASSAVPTSSGGETPTKTEPKWKKRLNIIKPYISQPKNIIDYEGHKIAIPPNDDAANSPQAVATEPQMNMSRAIDANSGDKANLDGQGSIVRRDRPNWMTGPTLDESPTPAMNISPAKDVPSAPSVSPSVAAGGEEPAESGAKTSEASESNAGTNRVYYAPSTAVTSRPAPPDEKWVHEMENKHARMDAVKGAEHKIKTIQDWLDAHPPESEADRKKRERRERSKRIIAGVTDGLTALSNLYFTSQYAPNAYNYDRTSAKKAVDARIAKLKEDRDKENDAYLRYSLALGDAKTERANISNNLKFAQDRNDREAAQANQQAKEHHWKELLQPFIRGEHIYKQEAAKHGANKAKSDAETAESKAKTAKIVADYAEKQEQADLGVKKSRTAANNASATNSLAGADLKRAQKGTEKAKQKKYNSESRKEGYTAWDENGNPRVFQKEKNADTYAQNHGTYVPAKVEEGKRGEKISTPGYRRNPGKGSAKSKFSIHKKNK